MLDREILFARRMFEKILFCELMRMEKIYSFWEVMMLPNIARFYDNKYLSAIRHTFYVSMPFWLTISFFDILGNLFLNPTGFFMERDGLNLGFWLTGGLTGEDYLQNTAVIILNEYKKIIAAGYNLTAITASVALANKLSDIWDSDKFLNIFCSLAAVVFISPFSAYEQKEITDYFSSLGFFSAFFVTFLSSKLFSKLYHIKKLFLKTPKSFPQELSHYVSAVLPVLLTLTIFSLLSLAVVLLKDKIDPTLEYFSDSTIFQNLFFVMIYQFFVWVLWWLGIPGYSVTSKLQEIAYNPAQILNANSAGESAAIFTTGFFSAGVIHVLGLMIAIIVFSQHESWRKVSKFSMPFMFFNIQEIFLFGLPVVLNPIFLIPYILAPLANVVVGYIAISWGIVPVFQTDLPWTMPLLFSASAATHSIMGGVLQLVWLIMDIFIYAPFVITANSLKLDEEKKGGDKIG